MLNMSLGKSENVNRSINLVRPAFIDLDRPTPNFVRPPEKMPSHQFIRKPIQTGSSKALKQIRKKFQKRPDFK
jgi:hypothetical protein